MGKLGKGREIFRQSVATEERKERGEKTIFLINPSERQALDEFIWKAKREFREINNSMVVRSLLSIFSGLEVSTEGIESEDMLRDRILEALSSARMAV